MSKGRVSLVNDARAGELGELFEQSRMGATGSKAARAVLLHAIQHKTLADKPPVAPGAQEQSGFSFEEGE